MKLNPNEPCHCGSGNKYKKCCMLKDEKAARDASAANEVAVAAAAAAADADAAAKAPPRPGADRVKGGVPRGNVPAATASTGLRQRGQSR